VATNALITRRLPAAAMVTTRGFRDVIEIRRGTRDDLWDAYKDNAPPYIRRRDRFEVGERIGQTGEVLEALDEDDARRVARILARRGVETVAVCFINAYANPDHERRMAEILAEELPTCRSPPRATCCPSSSSTSASPPRWPTRSCRRSCRATSPSSAALATDGYDGDLLILHSGGGVMTPEAVERLACGWRPPGSPRARGLPLHGGPVRLPQRHRARHGRHEHGHLARPRRPPAGDERLVRRVRLPHLPAVDRGPDDRRGRRLPGHHRRRGLPAQRPAVRGLGARARELRDGRGGADEHGREPRARPPGPAPRRRRDDARRRARARGDPHARGRAAGPLGARGGQRDHPGGQREHGRRRSA
jgi:hypothetical protein